MPYRFLPHTADAYFEAWGDTWEEVLCSSVQAFYAVMFEGEREGKEEKTVVVEAEDIDILIHDVLEELLFLLDVEGFVGAECKAEITGNGTLRAVVRIRGEKLDPRKHRPKDEVKAVTYHELRAWEEGGKKYFRCILDL